MNDRHVRSIPADIVAVAQDEETGDIQLIFSVGEQAFAMGLSKEMAAQVMLRLLDLLSAQDDIPLAAEAAELEPAPHDATGACILKLRLSGAIHLDIRLPAAACRQLSTRPGNVS